MVDSLLLDMCSNDLIPDTVTYNTIINAYCRAQDMNGTMNFMNKMFAAGCEPDIFTYNIWMHSLCSNHMLNQAGKVLDELVTRGCPLNSVTYNTLMDGICSDVLDRAMILTGRLIKMAFQPNLSHLMFSFLISASKDLEREPLCGLRSSGKILLFLMMLLET